MSARITIVGIKGTIYPQYMYRISAVLTHIEKRYMKRAIGAINTKLPIWLATFESLNRVESAILLKIIDRP